MIADDLEQLIQAVVGKIKTALVDKLIVFNASKRGISTAVDASAVEEADADMAGKEDTKGIA